MLVLQRPNQWSIFQNRPNISKICQRFDMKWAVVKISLQKCSTIIYFTSNIVNMFGLGKIVCYCYTQVFCWSYFANRMVLSIDKTCSARILQCEESVAMRVLVIYTMACGFWNLWCTQKVSNLFVGVLRLGVLLNFTFVQVSY